MAAIRVQDPDVFEETHKLVFSLIAEGKVTGLRVDHPDGLYYPSEYLQRLQGCCFGLMRNGNVKGPCYDPSGYAEALAENLGYRPFYIVAEKILTRDEGVPEGWPVFSTTGYAFMNTVGGIFVDTTCARAFDEIYNRFVQGKANFQDIVYENKKLIMRLDMASEVNSLGHYLSRIAENNRHTRDFTLSSLINALVEVVAYFPVYRTYSTAMGVTERDRKYIELAIGKAKRNNLGISASVFDFVKDVLLLDYPESCDEDEKRECLDFSMRFQQFTAPVMAKGVEDTAFYIYNRLVSLNEVGGSPERFGASLDTFHGKNIERTKSWPHALSATSTHDSKRSEDVRARLNVLSELNDQWRGCIGRWSRMNKKKKTVAEGIHIPDRNDEYLLYQTLVGAWPFGEADEAFRLRIKDYLFKAAREAKVNTRWINPNTAYEDAMALFIDRLFADTRFLTDFLGFQRQVAHFGMFNSLSQTLLKITSPGVPDFYQGTELWDLSLVDPDNRRPIDYEMRIAALEALKKREADVELARELTAMKDDGTIKLYLTWKALNIRRANRGLFATGEYIPVEAKGGGAEHICAYVRRDGGGAALTVVPRLLASFITPDTNPLGENVWGDTSLALPFEVPGSRYRNVFTGEVIECIKQEPTSLYAKDILREFPVALLLRT